MSGRTPTEKGSSAKPFLRSRKGVFDQLWQAAIGLGIFILVTALMGLMTQEVKEIAEDRPVSNTQINESMALVNNTGVAFAHNPVQVVGRVGNNTMTLTSGNYTFNTTHLNGSFVNTIEAGTYHVTYDYTNPSIAENITDSGLEALQLLGDWQTIVVIAVVMIVLIGLILRELGHLGGQVR